MDSTWSFGLWSLNCCSLSSALPLATAESRAGAGDQQLCIEHLPWRQCYPSVRLSWGHICERSEPVHELHPDVLSPSDIWPLLLKPVVIAETKGKHNLGRAFVLQLLRLWGLFNLRFIVLGYNLFFSTPRLSLQMWFNLLPWTVLGDGQGHQLQVFKVVCGGGLGLGISFRQRKGGDQAMYSHHACCNWHK